MIQPKYRKKGELKMLTKKDKNHIRDVHKIADDMERLGVSEKVINAFIKDKWLCFDYDPDQNFKYVGDKEMLPEGA